MKAVRRAAVYAVFRMTLLPLRLMPLALGVPLAKILGQLGYLGFGRLRKRAVRQVAAVFGEELPAREVKALVRRTFEHYSLLYFEFVNSDRFLAARPDLFEVIGRENLDRALQDGRGIIWLTGHVGNWEMMAIYISFVAGYKINIITRSLYD
ncbi:MAG: lysophospholipid acyltransferase family protein, partial [Vicinamibacteria bacterium]